MAADSHPFPPPSLYTEYILSDIEHRVGCDYSAEMHPTTREIPRASLRRVLERHRGRFNIDYTRLILWTALDQSKRVHDINGIDVSKLSLLIRRQRISDKIPPGSRTGI